MTLSFGVFLSSPAPTSSKRGPSRRRSKKRRGGGRLPDLLYHACSETAGKEAVRTGVLKSSRGQDVFLSSDEARTWRVGHRLQEKPLVVVVDVRRAVREGVSFRKGRTGLYLAERLPVSCLVNLQKGFREQHSAGGFLVRRTGGRIEICLVSCKRRSGVSWEIAKGKMEPGETPAATAVRELQEEMGFEADVRVTESLGMVRYVFSTPKKEVRLKAMHLFLMEASPSPETFSPAEGEGIVDVRWFPVSEARRLVRHSSLRPVLKELDRRYGGGSTGQR